ncbi:hypothetical protein FACS189459_2060 [Bacilli bacterium]|nr:hypothetical protein FACS189459_2060 [Bacilli bacterium]
MYSNGGAKILDLLHPEKKMSKTTDDVKGSIFLLDNPTVASKKIMGALTDNLNQVKYDPEKQPGIANLINIYVLLTKDLVLEKVNGYKKEITIKEIENKYKSSQNYGIFKKDLAKIVFDFLT